MKKFGLLTLALVLLGASVIPGSFASRDAYHNYLYQKYGTQDRVDTRNFNYGHRDRRGVNPSRNTRYSQHNTRNAFTSRTYTSNTNFPRRTSTQRIQPWHNKINRDAAVFKTMKAKLGSFVRYTNQHFEISVPHGWKPFLFVDNSYRFVNRQGDLLITVKQLDGCSTSSFYACSVAYSKDMNHKNPAERVLSASRIVRQSQFQNVLSDETLQAATFTESFAGRVGDQEIYITRYFVQSPDGSVYVVDARTPLRKGRGYLATIKEVFDSFLLITN